MKSLIIAGVFLIWSAFMVSCKHNDGPTNEYKNAKTHPSETIASGHKRATKRAEKTAKKTMKQAKKRANKRNGQFFKQ